MYDKYMASITTPRHNLENDKLWHKDLTKVKIITTPNQNIILGGSDAIAEPPSVGYKDLHHRRLQGSHP
jgi:hypothetical protein